MIDFPVTFNEFKNLPGRKDPFYFGLGFIKVRLDHDHSMNFYDPGLGSIVGDEEIHNHRTNFESLIIAGELTNVVYELEYDELPRVSHTVTDAVCTEGGSEKVIGHARIKRTSSFTMARGSRYSMETDTFHRVYPGSKGAITALSRGKISKDSALVVRPIGENPVCPYSRKIELPELMDRIEALYMDLT
jgi:hypothetical protein